jgi:Mor family transcriptional regulator
MNGFDIDFEKDFEEEVAVIGTSSFATKDDELVFDYSIGATIAQLKDKYNLTKAQVYKILHTNGVALHNTHTQSKSRERILTMTEREKSTLVADYKSGMSTKAIQEKYNINKHGCYIVLDEAGVPRRMKRGKQLESSTESTAGVSEAGTVTEAKTTVTPIETLDIEIPVAHLKEGTEVTIVINLVGRD